VFCVFCEIDLCQFIMKQDAPHSPVMHAYVG